VSQFFENSGGAAYRVFRVAKTTEALSRLEASYQQLNLLLESNGK
jgi:hypothetical protein